MLKISFDQKYIYPLEENHRFPMIKYELIPKLCEKFRLKKNLINPIYMS